MTDVFEKAVAELNIDRSDWQLVKFGDVAIQQKQTVDRENTELTRYVKGEHMYSEDIHLREWGELTDEYLGPAFIRKFEEGDILYGSRRTYLRKVVIAPFEGITSNTTFVIKANEERIDKRLLPFIMLSEGFSQHSIKNSKGSVNPYVNWKDLAGYEFLLPPISDQQKIADLFLSIDNLTEHELSLLHDVKFQSKVYLTKSFRNGAFLNQTSKKSEYGEIPASWELKKLSELGEFKNGVNKDKEQFGFGKPFVNLLDVFGVNELSKKDFDLVNASTSDLENYNLKKGDVLFIRSSVKPTGVGLTALIKEDLVDTVFSGFIIRFRPFLPELSDIYKKYCFYEDRFRYSLCRRSTISANTNINQESLNRLSIPVPPADEQQEFGRRMLELEVISSEVENKITNTKKLKNSLINQVF